MNKKFITNLSYEITGCAIEVHKGLGPGLLESVYQSCLEYELLQKGFEVKSNVLVPVKYNGHKLNSELRLDLLINDLVIIELKCVEGILPVHEAQLLTYLKLLNKPQGLLINFFTTNIVKSMKPMVTEFFASLPDEE